MQCSRLSERKKTNVTFITPNVAYWWISTLLHARGRNWNMTKLVISLGKHYNKCSTIKIVCIVLLNGLWKSSGSLVKEIKHYNANCLQFKAEIRIMRHVSNIKSNTIGLLQLIAHFAKHIHKTYTSLISKRSRSTVPVLFVLCRVSVSIPAL